MHIYQTAYRRNLRRNAAIVCVLAAGAVVAFGMRRYSEVIPLAILPLAVFAIVHVIMLSELVKKRRRFEAGGDADANESRFDAEFRSADRLSCDHLHFTANWLFSDQPSDTFLVPISEIAWMYRMTENNTTPHLVIHFRDDDKVEIIMREDEIDAILHLATMKYPHIVIGYSKELAAASDGDKRVFRAKLAGAPRVFVDDSSPFINPYYQTVVYVKREGRKRKGLLALTREERLVLLCGGDVLFDRAVGEIDSAASWWFGRLRVRFGHPDWAAYTVKTYNVRRWLTLLCKARRGAPLGGCEKRGYSDVDSYNFAASQNRYYIQFVAGFISLLFFGLIHFTYWSKGDSLWEEGIAMGIATFFLLPLFLPPILVYGIFYLKGLQGTRLFPNREDGE